MLALMFDPIFKNLLIMNNCVGRGYFYGPIVHTLCQN